MFSETRQLFHWRRTFHKGREFAYCKRLIAGVMLFAAATATVEAAPTGGTVHQPGGATITQTMDGALTHTEIDQNLQRVDIDWTGFDTAAGENVHFDQDHSSWVAINRISGAETSFNGNLTGIGQIFLINQQGIIFGSAARVNVGSLLATSSDTDLPEIDGEDYQVAVEGGQTSYVFDGEGYARIMVEEGAEITVSDGGFAVLAAPYVENAGFIKADLGQVELASTNGYELNVDLRGDKLIKFTVRPESMESEQPLGVTNTDSGVLQARSGHVYLTANMASDIVQGVINLDGVVDADQFVEDKDGRIAMVDSHHAGGNIVVKSVGDINIGGGADIHAIGGAQVSGTFQAADNIDMGSEDDPASITLKATGELTDEWDNRAGAVAKLRMAAGGGDLNIHGGEIEVTADANADSYTGHDKDARAVATALLRGENVNINAGINVGADAQVAGGAAYGGDSRPGKSGSVDGAEALATLNVQAHGDYKSAGDLAMTGDVAVDATAGTDDSRAAMATANGVIVATGNVDVEGDIDVNAAAVSDVHNGESPDVPTGCQGPDCNGSETGSADANAALVMLAGVPAELIGALEDLSNNRSQELGTLSDLLTLTNLAGLMEGFEGFEGFDGLDGIGDGDLNYRGDINVTARAGYNDAGYGYHRDNGLAQATAAGLLAAGGDAFIDTDPIKVRSEAYANYDEVDYYEPEPYTDGDYEYPSSRVDTEARSSLVFAAGLADLEGMYCGESDCEHAADLTILGDVSARAYELETLNGEPHPYPGNPLTGALTVLYSTGDITVRGADPLAEAGPLSDPGQTALAQGRTTTWEACDMYGCWSEDPQDSYDDFDGLEGLVYGERGAYVAQLIIEAGCETDIQPKQRKIQPVGLFKDPIGPGWPGDKPLRFAADGQMLVATGADATRPPRMTALDSDIEAAILAGGDPTALLPATASGGCVAAGRDAFTVSESDYFDRLISRECKTTID